MLTGAVRGEVHLTCSGPPCWSPVTTFLRPLFKAYSCESHQAFSCICFQLTLARIGIWRRFHVLALVASYRHLAYRSGKQIPIAAERLAQIITFGPAVSLARWVVRDPSEPSSFNIRQRARQTNFLPPRPEKPVIIYNPPKRKQRRSMSSFLAQNERPLGGRTLHLST